MSLNRFLRWPTLAIVIVVGLFAVVFAVLRGAEDHSEIEQEFLSFSRLNGFNEPFIFPLPTGLPTRDSLSYFATVEARIPVSPKEDLDSDERRRVFDVEYTDDFDDAEDAVDWPVLRPRRVRDPRIAIRSGTSIEQLVGEGENTVLLRQAPEGSGLVGPPPPPGITPMRVGNFDVYRTAGPVWFKTGASSADGTPIVANADGATVEAVFSVIQSLTFKEDD